MFPFNQRFSLRVLAWIVLFVVWVVFVESFALSNVESSNIGQDIEISSVLSPHEEILQMIEPYLIIPFQGNPKDKKSISQVKRYIREACSTGKAKLSPSTQRRIKRRMAPLDVDQCTLVLEFLASNFSKETIGTILLSHPRILRRNPKSQLYPTILFLADIYRGVDGAVEEAICKNPSLLFVRGLGHHNIENGSDKIEEFLSNELGVSAKKLEQLTRTKPQTFEYSLDNMRSVCCFIGSLVENDLSSYDRNLVNQSNKALSFDDSTFRILRKMLLSDPYLFSCSVENNLLPTINYLRDNFGFSSASVLTLVKACPGILGLSIEKNLSPKLRFFQEAMGLKSLSDLSRCTSRHPQILALSLSNLQKKVSLFDEIDRLSDVDISKKKQLAYRIALQQPTVFSLSLKENLIPKIKCLASMWGFTYNVDNFGSLVELNSHYSCEAFSLSQLIGEYPAILTSSLEDNILPTINFFNSTGYLQLDGTGCSLIPVNDKKSDRKVSIIRGRVLASSLYNNLLPRWHFLKQKGKVNKSCNVLPPLYILATSSNSKFCDYFHLSNDEFDEFKNEMIPKLKFSVQFVQWMKTGKPVS